MAQDSVIDTSGLVRKRTAQHAQGPSGGRQGSFRGACVAGRCASPARPADRVSASHPGCTRVHRRGTHRGAGAGAAAGDDRSVRGGELLPSLRRGEGRRDPPPAPITVRVCETLSCQLAGAEALRAELGQLDERQVRVIGVPCIGRCEHAPAAVVGRNTIDRASPSAIAAAIQARSVEAELPSYVGLDGYRRSGRLSRRCAPASPASGRSTRSSPRSSNRRCAAWAARVFRQAANGASYAPRRRHG